MNFKFYDIFSSLIPGFLFLICLLEFLGFDFDKDLVVPYTAIAFLMGYLMNTLGSWLEDIYFFSWGGKPSSKLLLGKTIWKVQIYNHSQLRANLIRKTDNANPTTNELFSIALMYANGEKDSRIEDLNSNYAFSRTLLTTSLLGGPLYLSQHGDNWKYYLIIGFLILVLWLRCKQRAYYFSKEVLNVYSRKEGI